MINDLPCSSVTELWASCEEALDIEKEMRCIFGQRDPFRRVYLHEDVVIKIEFPELMTSCSDRYQSIVGEYQLYRDCNSIKGVASAIDLRQSDCFDAIYLQRIHGLPVPLHSTGWLSLAILVVKLGIISYRLSMKGIAHNDFFPANILVSPNGQVTLIDFDQAFKTGRLDAILRNIFGISTRDRPVHAGIFKVIKSKIRISSPKWLLSIMRRTKNVFVRGRNRRQLPSLPAHASEKQQKMLKAWKHAQNSDANAPGEGIAYYAVEVDGLVLPGERPWEPRWSIFKNLMDYRGKRILELGCNMGLLSTYLLREQGAQAALATDMDETILKSAKCVAAAFDVDVSFECVDFDQDADWENRLLHFRPDVVFALNVLNWLEDKNRFLTFLGKFSCLVFEGHDSFEVEKQRLRDAGFDSVEFICSSERSRPIMICKKSNS